MNEELNLDFRVTPAWLVVRYEGDLNLLVKDEFCRRVQAELEKHSGSDLVLDMSGVAMLDSSGLGAIFTLYKSQTARQRQMVLAGPNRQVAELLRLTHLDKVMRIEENLSELLGGS